jgi:hypothetical protein
MDGSYLRANKSLGVQNEIFENWEICKIGGSSGGQSEVSPKFFRISR